MTEIQIHPIAYVFTDDEKILTIAQDHSLVDTRYCVNIEFAINDIECLDKTEILPEEKKFLRILKRCVKKGCSGDAIFIHG